MKTSKKIASLIAASTLALSIMTAPVFAEIAIDLNPPRAVAVETVKSDSPETTVDYGKVMPAPRGVNVVNKSVSVKVGSSYSKSFKMNNFLADPHNAFKITVNNPSGDYTVKVTKSDGSWSHDFSEKNYSATVEVNDCVPDVTYTVYVMNTGDETLSADVSITSFFQ